ncbi:DUF58 domain-containing protein [Promicromonospora thailandica]|uniref:DUF58 domain-containing protein n=1 Tax=Promicromonospora thailandica TaxID=765201 RepID=A0A9X2GF89_9MICO|nr:DUF58 domain-containing protein [Promicromonospora thailandica]MCP2267501.1 Protein of unknown function DUF58 [Promicromonospora thailandica]BFF19060.1 DUF58 domain-containing protein [Promicromonospora thailandica]
MTTTGLPAGAGSTGYGKRQERPRGLGGAVAAGRTQLLRGQRGWVTLTAAARSRAAAVGRVLDPVRRTFSTFGIAVTLAAVAAWVAGLMLGWLEVLVAAIVLTVTLVCAIVFVLGRFKYDVVLDLAQARVTVGDRAVGRLDVRNASSRALLPSVMELPVGSGTAAFPVPRLPGGGSHEEIFTIPTRRRSVITVGPVKSVRADPLGLLRREMTWTDEQEVFVHPRVKNLTGSSTGFLKDLEGRVTNDITNSDVNFHALRDYVPGDDRRHIHWKTTARTGQLMVRQFEETRRSHLAVLLSTRAEDYANEDEFELAVSVCGSLGLQAIKEDRGVTVLVNEATLRGDHRTRLMDDLSRIELESRKSKLVDLARSAAMAAADFSVIAFVVGSRVTPTELRSASARVPAGVQVMAIQCQPGASLGRHAIAELGVLTLGRLADLPLALKKMSDG